MSKKKATAKKPEPQVSRPARVTRPKSAAPASKPAKNVSAQQPQAASTRVYQYEIDENPSNAPLVVDIPIAEGRGEQPPRPSFVSFTAEMADEYWHDQFAFRVISLSGDAVRVMISRIDKESQELGWGIKLVVRVLVVDLTDAAQG